MSARMQRVRAKELWSMELVASSVMAAVRARSLWNDNYETNAIARAEGKDGEAHNVSYGVGFEVKEDL